MAYLDYVGLAYFKSLLDENYLRTNYEGDTVINGNVTFTEPVNASVKNDWLGHQIDKTYIKDVTPDPEGSGALALILGDGTVSHLITDTTVTQVRSNANELYPILLCYDAFAEEDQIAKKVWYGNGVRINPRYGYLYSQKMFTLHPSYNRASAPTSRVEWTSDFRDSVLNPVGQVFEYIDPVSSGGEHRMEFRLYGNPNVAGINTPNVNDETNTISMGVSATRGDTLTFFGYCPSTPIYLENGSTMRKSLTRGDQYGRDIITRDWLNLNGSITGLVHTYMDETIDGAKTFKKTVTINSGDNNNKAGLYVQGNSDIHGNEHVYGTETVDGKLTANGTAEIKGGSGNNPSLLVTGNESVSGNSSVGGNSSVAGNETVSGKITGNNGAEINGGNGLVVNGNETVTGEIYKTINNIPQEYVSYVTNKQETKTTIVNNLIKDKGGLAADSNKNIYVNTGKGLTLDSTGKINVDFSQLPAQDITNIVTGMVAPGSGLVADSSTGKLSVDFSQMPDDHFNALLATLKMQIPLTENLTLYVNKGHASASDTSDVGNGRGLTTNKPFKSIQACAAWAASYYALGPYNITIVVYPGVDYTENLALPAYNATSGTITIRSSADAQPPVIHIASGGNPCVRVTGGDWRFHRIKFLCNPTLDDVSHIVYPSCISVMNGAIVYIYGCDFDMSYYGAETTYLHMSVCSVGSNGTLTFMPIATYPTTVTYHQGNSNQLYAFGTSDGGRIVFAGGYGDLQYAVPCSGDASIFASSGANSSMRVGGTGEDYIHFVVAANGTCTGKKYSVDDGSNMRAPYGGFPGNIEGTVDSVSYCWYKQQSNPS